MKLNKEQIIRLINIKKININILEAYLEDNYINLVSENAYYPFIPVNNEDREFIINGIKLEREVK